MPTPKEFALTRRESELMDVIWELHEVTVEQLREKLGGQLSGSSLRTLLSILEDKGCVSVSKCGKANLYRALVRREEAQAHAVRSLKERLFRGSASTLLARLVEEEEIPLEEIGRLRRELRSRRKEGR